MRRWRSSTTSFASDTYISGVKFVDTWSGFTDQLGAFSAYGPDLTGQSKRLREPDGISFTARGNRKLANFVEIILGATLPPRKPRETFRSPATMRSRAGWCRRFVRPKLAASDVPHPTQMPPMGPPPLLPAGSPRPRHRGKGAPDPVPSRASRARFGVPGPRCSRAQCDRSLCQRLFASGRNHHRRYRRRGDGSGDRVSRCRPQRKSRRAPSSGHGAALL